MVWRRIGRLKGEYTETACDCQTEGNGALRPSTRGTHIDPLPVFRCRCPELQARYLALPQPGRIRELLYEQGFTISGARNRLSESHASPPRQEPPAIEGLDVEITELADGMEAPGLDVVAAGPATPVAPSADPPPAAAARTTNGVVSLHQMRQELLSIRGLLTG